MAQKYENDETGELSKCFNHVMNKYAEHKDKSSLSYLFAWRSDVKLNCNNIVIGEVNKFANRDRDLLEYDVRVVICENTWNQLTKEEKIKTAYHQLSHIKIEYTGEIGSAKIKADKEGRVVFSIIDHDFNVTGFKNEVKLFGLDTDQKSLIKKLYKYVK